MIKVGTCPGSRFKNLYKRDKSGYLLPKFVKKDGKDVRATEDFWQSIQDSSMEEKFNQIFNDSKNQEQVMSLMRQFANQSNDDVIYEDITTGKDYVDLMNDFVKLSNSFPNDKGYSDMNTLNDRIKLFAEKRKKFYESQRKIYESKKNNDAKGEVKQDGKK